MKIFQIGERDVARIEIVRAGANDVGTSRRTFHSELRLEVRIEKRSADVGQILFDVGVVVWRLRVVQRDERRARELLFRERRHELLSIVVVVISVIAPEEFRELDDLHVRRRIDSFRMRDDQLEDVFLAQAVRRELIVENRIDGDRGVAQPVRELFLFLRQIAEAVRFDANETVFADSVGE